MDTTNDDVIAQASEVLLLCCFHLCLVLFVEQIGNRLALLLLVVAGIILFIRIGREGNIALITVQLIGLIIFFCLSWRWIKCPELFNINSIEGLAILLLVVLSSLRLHHACIVRRMFARFVQSKSCPSALTHRLAIFIDCGTVTSHHIGVNHASLWVGSVC